MSNAYTYDKQLADLFNSIQEAEGQTQQFIDFLDRVTQRALVLAPFNAFLVQMQRPGAGYIMTARDWMKHGRRPIPSAPALLILHPFAPCIPAFEFSDTEEIPDFAGERIDFTMAFDKVKPCPDPTPYIAKLLEHACHVGIDPVGTVLGDALAGDARRCDRGVKVVHRARHDHFFTLRFMVRYNIRKKPAVQFQTLVHEFSHILLGHQGPLTSDGDRESWNSSQRRRATLPKVIKELEAEAVAYIVCMGHGVDGNSAGYLREHVGNALDDAGEWPREMSVEEVMKAAHLIYKLLGPYEDIPVKKKIRSSKKREGTAPLQLTTMLGAEPPAQPAPAAGLEPGVQDRLFRAVSVHQSLAHHRTHPYRLLNGVGSM